MADAIAITNVRVFDGNGLTEERTVVIENGLISSETTAQTKFDGQHGTLLPGFIDSHVHLTGISDLEQGTQWGCTTLLDMGCQNMAVTDSLRHRHGLADVLGVGNIASAPGGVQTTFMGYPASSAVTGPEDARRFVAERVADGGDFIKIIAEDPNIMGPAAFDIATIKALVEEAHKAGLKAIAHVTTLNALKRGAEAGVDILTHAPYDADVDDNLAASLAAKGIVTVPTLIAMYVIAGTPAMTGRLKGLGVDVNFAHSRETVAAFYRAGVKILAGTDSYQGPAAPASIKYGESFHDELSLLVEAGMTPVEVLRAATIEPAQYFGFADKGAVEPGRRADLLLVEGDPTRDISATRAIRGVWAGGVQVR
jgi:imidazolonepropionase-like amidohydrolase